MKKTFLIGSLILGLLGLNAGMSYARQKLICKGVAAHLSESKMLVCPEGENCVAFKANLTTTKVGDSYECQFIGTATWSSLFTDGETFNCVDDGVSEDIADASVANNKLSVSYNIVDVGSFSECDQFELGFTNLGGFPTEQRIYFSKIILDGVALSVDITDNLKDIGSNIFTDGFTGFGNFTQDDTNGTAGGSGSVWPDPISNDGLKNIDIKEISDNDPPCEGCVSIDPDPSLLPPDDPVGGGNGGGVNNVGQGTGNPFGLFNDPIQLQIQGGCSLSPNVSYQFGFGWLALLGLIFASLPYRLARGKNKR